MGAFDKIYFMPSEARQAIVHMKTLAAAIDFGTSKIVTLLAESGGYHRCDIIGTGVTDYDGFMDGDWNNPDDINAALMESIRSCEAEAHKRINEVYIGVPGEFIRIHQCEAAIDIKAQDGRVTHKDAEMVQDAACDMVDVDKRDIIHRSPAWFKVDSGEYTMSPVDVRGNQLRAMVCVFEADKSFMDDITYRLKGMGIRVLGFLSTSLGQSLLLIPHKERDTVALLVDVGYLSTEVMAVQGDALLFQEVLPVGGGHITADLVYGLEASMQVCEEIKRGFAFDDLLASQSEVIAENGRSVRFSPEFINEIITARVDEIIDLVQDSFDKSGVSINEKTPLYFTGGGIAMMRGSKEYVSNKLGKSIKQPVPKASKLNSYIYTSSLGLMDLVFDMIEQQVGYNDNIIDRILNFFRSLFNK